MKARYFMTNAGQGPFRYVRWDDAHLSDLRDLVELFGVGGEWEVRVTDHEVAFFKDGTKTGNIGPGQWMQLTTFTSNPDIMNDANLRSSYYEVL